MALAIELRRQTTQRSAWFAIAAVFFVNGVTLASWISRIPTLTERLDIGPGQLGVALMAKAGKLAEEVRQSVSKGQTMSPDVRRVMEIGRAHV